MTEIMRSNAQRVSAIVDNVLRLSRREPPRPERIALADWCARFRDEFCADHAVRPGALQAAARRRRNSRRWSIRASCTRSCGTCARTRCATARADGGEADVEVQLLRVARYGRVCLEVSRSRHRAWRRPTSSASSSPSTPAASDGTGLGLFLARELAEINGATLLYEPRKGGGSVFRLVFADPSRWAAAMLPAAPVL